MARKVKGDMKRKKTRKFGGKEFKHDWTVSGKGSKKWADVRKQELKDKGYKARVVKGRYKGDRINITVHRVYKRK